MGNCQAAEAAAVVIQHSSGKVETVYWSLSANQVMAANPGHYVAIVIASTSNSSDSHGRGNGAPVKQLKLLRPDDTLHIGHVYRLVSFEEVLKEFASKRHAKLGRLLYKQKDKPSSRKVSSGRGGERRQEKRKTKRDLPPPPSLRPSAETPIAMARPKNPRTIYPGSHHQPTNRYFYYNSVTLFPSHHSHSLFSTLLSNSLKTPRKPTLFSHHANIVLLFLFLLLFTFSFLAFPKIPFLLTSPNSIVRRASATSPLDSTVAPLPAHDITGNLTQEEREFWEQPDGQGYQPCIEFSLAYRQASARITRERRRFVVAVVSGGLNQQRNQIVDVVVIARILESSMQVAFHALRFTAPIRELGDKLARRMWAGGSYVAVHLRLEKDVWIRTRCLPGLGPEYDQLVMDERRSHPELLTGQLNLTHNRRRLAGLCPLNASEVAAYVFPLLTLVFPR